MVEFENIKGGTPKGSIVLGTCFGYLAGISAADKRDIFAAAFEKGLPLSKKRFHVCRYGALDALFSGSYVGVYDYISKKRGVEDVHNFIGAGNGAAAVFGLAGAIGPPLIRLKSPIKLAIELSAFSLPFAHFYNYLLQKINDWEKRETHP